MGNAVGSLFQLASDAIQLLRSIVLDFAVFVKYLLYLPHRYGKVGHPFCHSGQSGIGETAHSILLVIRPFGFILFGGSHSFGNGSHRNQRAQQVEQFLLFQMGALQTQTLHTRTHIKKSLKRKGLRPTLPQCRKLLHLLKTLTHNVILV